MAYRALNFDPTARNSGWRRMFRVEARSGLVSEVSSQLDAIQPECRVYAEGDSWFDKFTPFGARGTNLLDALRVPKLTAVVDVAHIGDLIEEMVGGGQAAQTEVLLDFFPFDAILLSAGGNDLRALFAREFSRAPQGWTLQKVRELVDPALHGLELAPVVANLRKFVALRDHSALNAQTPIFLHGYDYIQPRPAGAEIFKGSRIGGGPWLHPLLVAMKFNTAQMRAVTDAVIDALNEELAKLCTPGSNVVFIDQRGLLTPAAPDTTGPDADWADEIHPGDGGYAKVARERWDVLLAEALGWRGPTVAARDPGRVSMAGDPSVFDGWTA